MCIGKGSARTGMGCARTARLSLVDSACVSSKEGVGWRGSGFEVNEIFESHLPEQLTNNNVRASRKTRVIDLIVWFKVVLILCDTFLL